MNFKKFLFPLLFAGFLMPLVACKNDKAVEPSNTAIIDDELKKLDKDAFSKEIKKSGAVVIDVRMPQDFEQGHIEGAMNISFFDPEFKYKLLDLDRDKSYFIYEKGEATSFRSMKFMEDNGFKHVRMLKGGYKEWTTVHAADEQTTK